MWRLADKLKVRVALKPNSNLNFKTKSEPSNFEGLLKDVKCPHSKNLIHTHKVD